ncbi:unnamed protein product [Soboliphyme baturini]|uniref:Protein transport protein Sec24-like n=1 Tax=Soboliphyme baturini TaxID=241478 RepID=A0A183J580_9BILA|nr:unnamed protein product [Soboliphyme baturini]
MGLFLNTVYKSVTSTVSDAREALFNSCVDAVATLNRHLHASTFSASLLSPKSLSLLPLYILGLMKHTAFSYGTSIKLDHRVMAMANFMWLPISLQMLEVHPNLYSLSSIAKQEGDLLLLPLSFENIEKDGVYLMDAGSYMYLYIGKDVPDSFCSSLFGVVKPLDIDPAMVSSPTLLNCYILI